MKTFPRTTMDLGQVGQLREGVLVPERDVDEAVVGKGGECVGDGDFLSTTLCAGGDEDTAHLASKSGFAPEWTSCVPEGLVNCMRTRHIRLVAWSIPSTGRGSYRSGWGHQRGTRQS